jgi:DNA-binding transcriptional LysR family regulator
MPVLTPLTLDQLRILVTICDAGSFSAAGRALGRVQSAISQAVKSLEESQGVLLFDRGTHKPRLTPVGEVLVEHARTVLASADRFSAIAAGTRAGLEPTLALAIDPLVPTAPLIESLRALQQAFPDLPVSFSTEGVSGAERRLRDGSASLAFCLLLPTPPDDLTAHLITELPLVPVVAKGHPLARLRRTVRRADLEAHVQLVLSSGASAEHAGVSYGVVSERVWRFVDLGRRLDFLLAGFGWCKLPLALARPHLAARRLVRLDLSDESIAPTRPLPVYAAHVRDRPLGRAGRWLLDDLRTRLAQGARRS